MEWYIETAMKLYRPKLVNYRKQKILIKLKNCLIYNICRSLHEIRLIVRFFLFSQQFFENLISDGMNILADTYEYGDVEMKGIGMDTRITILFSAGGRY